MSKIDAGSKSPQKVDAVDESAISSLSQKALADIKLDKPLHVFKSLQAAEKKLKPLLEQFGDTFTSKTHLSGYVLAPATLDRFIRYINMAGINKEGSRASEHEAERAGNVMYFDHDGMEDTLKSVLDKMFGIGSRYLAYPTASHKTKFDSGERRFRLAIPVADGLTVDNYKWNLLMFAKEVEMNFDGAWDEATLKIKQPIYPSIMKGITEPKAVKKKKPSNMTVGYVLENLKWCQDRGEPWTPQATFTDEEKAELNKMLPQTKIEGAKGKGGADYVSIADDKMLTLNGEDIGTFKELSEKVRADDLFGDSDELRCDCPFDPSEHSDKGGTFGHGYGYFDKNGTVHCRSAHGNLRGVLKEDMRKVVDAEVVTSKKSREVFILNNQYVCVHHNPETNDIILYEKLIDKTLNRHHLRGYKKDRRAEIIAGAKLIGGIDHRISLVQEEKAVLDVQMKEDGKSYLVITRNPIKYWTFDDNFVPNQPLLDEYFNKILGGKVQDVIDIVALTIKLKQTKKNHLMLVAPTDSGKTELFEQMNFQLLTGLEWTKSISGKDSIAEETSVALMMKGLALIDDFPYIDTINTKNSFAETKLRVMQQGFTSHPTLFKAYTTTDIGKAATLADELWNRFMVVVIPDLGLTVPNSKYYNDDHEEYRRQTTTVLRQMIVKAFEQEADMNKLNRLRDKYSAEVHSEVPEMFDNVKRAVCESHSLVKFDNGLFGVVGRDIKKKVIRPALLNELDGEHMKDLNKHVNDIFQSMFNGKSSGFIKEEKNTGVFYLKDVFQNKAEDEIKDDFEEIEEF